jgi:peptide deformylase
MTEEKIDLVEPEKIPKIIDCSATVEELFNIGKKMEEICLKNKGIGLSAVQVGIPYNFFILYRNNKFEYYLDCSYEGNNDLIESVEGCLSLMNNDGSFRSFQLKRHSEVTIKGKYLKRYPEGNIKIKQFEKKENGFYGIVFQHEIDHAFGILISQIGKELE